jgi:DinB superfamily
MNKKNSIASVISIYNVQTSLFKNLTDSINGDIQQQLNEETNHGAWLIGHIVSGRYMVAASLGLSVEEPYPDLFKGGKGRQDVEYPSLYDLTKDWDTISGQLINHFENLSENDLQQESPFPLPIAEQTVEGMVSYFAHHEGYHLGQLGLLKKYLKL